MAALRGGGGGGAAAWIHSSGGKDPRDGTDKCWVRWMWLRTRYSPRIMLHVRKFMFISLFVSK